MEFEEQGIKTNYELLGDGRGRELRELVKKIPLEVRCCMKETEVNIHSDSASIRISPIKGEITYSGILELDKEKYDIKFQVNLGKERKSNTSSTLVIRENESGLSVHLWGDYRE